MQDVQITMTEESEKTYVLVPVLVTVDEEYVDLVAQQSPDDDHKLRDAAYRKIMDHDITALGNIKSSSESEEVTGEQLVNI